MTDSLIILTFSGFCLLLSITLVRSFRQPKWMRERSKHANNCVKLLSQAEAKICLREFDKAKLLFERVMGEALLAQNALYQSEALYGLANIELTCGEPIVAVPLLKLALALRKHWASDQPNFAELIKNRLAKIQPDDEYDVESDMWFSVQPPILMEEALPLRLAAVDPDDNEEEK